MADRPKPASIDEYIGGLPLGCPLPADLIRRIVRFRISELSR